MLTTATLGMALYGLCSILVGVTDLVATAQLEWWANLWLICAGAVLFLGAAFVRVSPGDADPRARPSDPGGVAGGAGLLRVGR
jgi:hypothetical protein